MRVKTEASATWFKNCAPHMQGDGRGYSARNADTREQSAQLKATSCTRAYSGPPWTDLHLSEASAFVRGLVHRFGS